MNLSWNFKKFFIIKILKICNLPIYYLKCKSIRNNPNNNFLIINFYEKMNILGSLSQIDIIEVDSYYIPDFKPVGKNFNALCPFYVENIFFFFASLEKHTRKNKF